MDADCWAVVLFTEKPESVAIAPENWLTADEKKCCWPPKSSKNVTDLVKSKHQPDEDWQLYDVKVLGHYDNYAKAFQKSKKAQVTSDLSSATDTKELPKKNFTRDALKKNKRKRYRMSSTEVESDSDKELIQYARIPKTQSKSEIEIVGNSGKLFRTDGGVSTKSGCVSSISSPKKRADSNEMTEENYLTNSTTISLSSTESQAQPNAIESGTAEIARSLKYQGAMSQNTKTPHTTDNDISTDNTTSVTPSTPKNQAYFAEIARSSKNQDVISRNTKTAHATDNISTDNTCVTPSTSNNQAHSTFEELVISKLNTLVNWNRSHDKAFTDLRAEILAQSVCDQKKNKALQEQLSKVVHSMPLSTHEDLLQFEIMLEDKLLQDALVC